MKNNIRRIVVTGVHKADMIMYCAYILQKMKYRVLVCDETGNREMESCIRRPSKPISIVRYKEIDFSFSELTALDEGYDFIFYVQDFDEFPMREAEKRIFISDGTKMAIDSLIRDISRMSWGDCLNPEDCMIIYRDMYTSYAVDYVTTRLKSKVQEMSVTVVPHDCMDEACYYRMQFQPFSHMTDISADMDMAVRRMLQFVTGMDEKMIKKGIKLAKRGRAC